MTPPRPESRIKSLERRATDIEAQIEELSSDTAESLRVLRQHVSQGFEQAHAFVQERFSEITTRFDKMETRLDRIETRIDRMESAQAEQGQKLDQILALLQQ